MATGRAMLEANAARGHNDRMRTLRAIVFDFDGLIVETEQPIYDTYRAIFAEYGVELALDVWADVVGGSGHRDTLFDYFEVRLGHKVDREAVRARARRQQHDVVHALPAREGVAAHIEQAKEAGLQLAVASSSSREWVNGHLGRLGLLSPFDVVCAREDVQRTKPDPELYTLALDPWSGSRLGAEAQEAFAIEDSPNGVTAAKAAGLRCVVVPNPLTAQMSIGHADLRLGSLAEMSLAEVVAALAG